MFAKLGRARQSPSSISYKVDAVLEIQNTSVTLSDGGFVLSVIASNLNGSRTSIGRMSVSLLKLEASAREGEKCISQLSLKNACLDGNDFSSIIVSSDELMVSIPQSLLKMKGFVERLVDRSVFTDYKDTRSNPASKPFAIHLKIKNFVGEADVLKSLRIKYHADGIIFNLNTVDSTCRGKCATNSIKFISSGDTPDISLPSLNFSASWGEASLVGNFELGIYEFS